MNLVEWLIYAAALAARRRLALGRPATRQLGPCFSGGDWAEDVVWIGPDLAAITDWRASA